MSGSDDIVGWLRQICRVAQPTYVTDPPPDPNAVSVVPDYTGSVDAVLALIQERLPKARLHPFQYEDGAWNAIIRHRGVRFEADADTLALALLAATLRALPQDDPT